MISNLHIKVIMTILQIPAIGVRGIVCFYLYIVLYIAHIALQSIYP